MTTLPDLQDKIKSLVKHPDFIPEIIKYFFPNVSGYDNVKIAILCLMANQWDGEDRERIHILLFGKPGTGKTALMDPLEREWGALYISMDPSGASLKGDARKEDGGVKLLHQYDGCVVCIDDFELMKNMNVIRDVMERGSYTMAKGGKYAEISARDRFLVATNDIKMLPLPIVSRFDLIFLFDYPTIQQSIDILRSIITGYDIDFDPMPFLRLYMHLVQTHEPVYVDKKKIEKLFIKDFKRHGLTPDQGKEGRWIVSVTRLARGWARIHLTDIGPEAITWALAMKRQSDEVIRSIE